MLFVSWRHEWLCGQHLKLRVSIWRSRIISSLAHQVVSLDKELYSTLSVFTQVYKRVLRHTAGGGGGSNTLSMLNVKECGISSSRLGLWLVCT